MEAIKTWLLEMGDVWDAKPKAEKNIIALIGIIMAGLAVMQLSFEQLGIVN